jgi:hypothetical protein
MFINHRLMEYKNGRFSLVIQFNKRDLPNVGCAAFPPAEYPGSKRQAVLRSSGRRERMLFSVFSKRSSSG